MAGRARPCCLSRTLIHLFRWNQPEANDEDWRSNEFKETAFRQQHPKAPIVEILTLSCSVGSGPACGL